MSLRLCRILERVCALIRRRTIQMVLMSAWAGCNVGYMFAIKEDILLILRQTLYQYNGQDRQTNKPEQMFTTSFPSNLVTRIKRSLNSHERCNCFISVVIRWRNVHKHKRFGFTSCKPSRENNQQLPKYPWQLCVQELFVGIVPVTKKYPPKPKQEQFLTVLFSK